MFSRNTCMSKTTYPMCMTTDITSICIILCLSVWDFHRYKKESPPYKKKRLVVFEQEKKQSFLARKNRNLSMTGREKRKPLANTSVTAQFTLITVV